MVAVIMIRSINAAFESIIRKSRFELGCAFQCFWYLALASSGTSGYWFLSVWWYLRICLFQLQMWACFRVCRGGGRHGVLHSWPGGVINMEHKQSQYTMPYSTFVLSMGLLCLARWWTMDAF